MASPDARHATKMATGPQGKPCEGWLRSLGLSSLEETEGRAHQSPQFPRAGKRRDRHCSLFSGDPTRAGLAWSCIRGSLGRTLESSEKLLCSVNSLFSARSCS